MQACPCKPAHASLPMQACPCKPAHGPPHIFTRPKTKRLLKEPLEEWQFWNKLKFDTGAYVFVVLVQITVMVSKLFSSSLIPRQIS
jgi:hypothetical protein